MAYLNWKETAIGVEVGPHPQYQTQLTLGLPQAEINDLISDLEAVFSAIGPELRLALPQGWTLIWKRREENSRSLVAHPQTDDWVGTVALELQLTQKLLFSLKNLKVGQSLILSDLGLLESVSNLEIVIFLK